jgi:glycosyltransferase involved in cell wall biosynthesis
MRAVLVIPALDEAAVIGGIIARVSRGPTAGIAEVIVVDNGSTDGTADVARLAGARVVTEPRRGYGAACWAGVAALPPDTDVAVFLDGDGSQDPEEIQRVLAPVVEGRADLVMGIRRFKGAHPAHARLGTWLVTRLVAWRYGVRLRDIGPFRAIRVDLLQRLQLEDRGFGWPVEMVVKAAARGGRIVEVEVAHRRRLGGHSKVSGTLRGSLRAAYAFLRVALRAHPDMSDNSSGARRINRHSSGGFAAAADPRGRFAWGSGPCAAPRRRGAKPPSECQK